MSRAPFHLLARRDETLYSILARLSHRLGEPPRAEFQGAVFGADLSIFDDLPLGLGVLVEGGWPEMGAETALRKLTLFPYYACFAAPDRQAGTRDAMFGDGPWPHQVLGSWDNEAPPPDSLRFCVTCRDEMLAGEVDAWWRRVHQLPSVLVCPDHGEVLLQSSLTRRRRRKAYVRASTEMCRAMAAPVTILPDRHMADDLCGWLGPAAICLMMTTSGLVLPL